MNLGYQIALEEIKKIMDKGQIRQSIQEAFEYYSEEITTCDEAAAILTLAEVVRGCGGLPGAEEEPNSKEVEGA